MKEKKKGKVILYQHRYLCSLHKNRRHLRKQRKRFKILKQNLILQIMNKAGHYLKEKEVIGLMKDELGGKIMRELSPVRAKIYSC